MTQAFTRLTMAALALTGLLVVGQLYLPLPLLGGISAHYAQLDFAPSWLVAGFGYAYALGFLVFGPLSDRFGRRRVMLIGLVGLMTATAAVAWARSGGELLAARLAQGFAAAAFPPVALAYINDFFPPERRGTAVAWMSCAFLSAVALAQALVLALSAVSLRLPETVILAAYALLWCGLWLLLKKDGGRTDAVSVWTLWHQLPRVLCAPTLWRLYALAVTVLFIFVGFYVAVVARAGATLSPLALRLWSLPFFAAGFGAAPLITRWGRVRALRLALCLGLTALTLAAAAQFYGLFWLLFGALCILSAAVALLVPLLIASVAQSAAAETRGAAVALYTFVLFCGASAAPLLFVHVSVWTALILSAGLWLIGTWLIGAQRA